METRRGILAAGNWIIDRVKIIDRWPGPGMLANILEETRSPGGAPSNVLLDLAALGPGFPLHALGRIGDDEDGRILLAELDRAGVDASGMLATPGLATSYTDVMTVAGTGARTFFHCRGANAALEAADFAGDLPEARIFHLGYLLLLDKLDSPHPLHGVEAAGLLASMRARGFLTSVDLVSEESDRFRTVVLPCLPHIDYLILNEIEASRTTGHGIRTPEGLIDGAALEASASALLEGGVRSCVAIHFPEGAYARLRGAPSGVFEPSYRVEPSDIKGTVGAGDAFCAGMLYALHEGWPLQRALRLAGASARFNLLDATATRGAANLAALTAFMEGAPTRPGLDL